MALFDKKFCDICGGKIGMLGNRKLDDGNCCKDCARQLSPWMTDRRRSTIADIKEHLAYREENKRNLARFNPQSVVGEDWKVMVDPNMGVFAVTRSNNWRADNPDLIPLASVVSCEIERKEQQHEVKEQLRDGGERSYSPPRYEYSYDFEVNINVSSPWFNEIEFKLNPSNIKDRYDPAYRQYEALGDQVRNMLLSAKNSMGGMGGAMPMGGMPMGGGFQQPMQQGYQQPGQFQQQPMQQQQQFQQQPMQQQPVQQPAPAPAAAGNWFCQSCGTPNTGKFCQSCGTPQR